MNQIAARWPIPLLFCSITVGATLALVDRVQRLDLVLDSLTACFAIVGAFVAAGRLCFGFADKRERTLWRAVLGLLALAALSEILGPLKRTVIDDASLLAIGPIMLWLTGRIDPRPKWAHLAAITAFLLQMAAVGVTMVPDAARAAIRVHPERIGSYADFAELLAHQLYLVAVVLIAIELKWRSGARTIATRLWPPPFGAFAPKRYNGQPIAVLRAAYLRAFLISVPWWQLPAVGLAALTWPFAIVAVSLGRDLPKHGPRVRALTGRSYWAQFRDHLSIGLSANLWPRHYYMFELFREELRPRAYEFLRRIETKSALYKLLRTDYREEDRFRDKVRFFRACARAEVRTVPVLLALTDGRTEHPQDARPPLPPSDLFIKPCTGRGGKGAEVVRFRDGLYHMKDGRAVAEQGLIETLLARSRVRPLLVQPRLFNHPALSRINMNALSTVRVVTATGTDGRGRVIAAALRVPSNAESMIDNFHAGGIAAAVDLETGRLGQATDLGIRGDSRWHSIHPVTGGQIEGLLVPDWPQLIDLAETAHGRIADRVVLGWDVAVLADGPCLIEANAFPDLDICQRTMLEPLGNGQLGQLMVHHLSRLAR
jgi:putative polysaccharide biosynthesis protein